MDLAALAKKYKVTAALGETLHEFIIRCNKELTAEINDDQFHVIESRSTYSWYYNYLNEEFRLSDHSKKDWGGKVDQYADVNVLNDLADIVDNLQGLSNKDLKKTTKLLNDKIASFERRSNASKKASWTRKYNVWTNEEKVLNLLVDLAKQSQLHTVGLLNAKGDLRKARAGDFIIEFAKQNGITLTMAAARRVYDQLRFSFKKT